MPANQRGMGRRERRTVEFDLGGEKQGTFRAGDELAKIEWLVRSRIKNIGVHQQIQRVAGVAARDGSERVVLADLPAVFGIG